MLSKSKARVIEIQDTRFRYKVSTSPRSRGVYEVNITIQSEDHNGRKLLVIGILQYDIDAKPSEGSDDHKYFPTIIRDDIDGYIREAIQLGWDYNTPGSDFSLSSTNEPFRLIPIGRERPPEWYQARNFQFKQPEGSPFGQCP